MTKVYAVCVFALIGKLNNLLMQQGQTVELCIDSIAFQ